MNYRQRQLPGRIEALRICIASGHNASPELRHLAGLLQTHTTRPRGPALPTVRIDSGIDQLTQEQRAALPF